MLYPDLDEGLTLDPEWWGKAAQATIRAYCGWHIAPVIDETIRIDSHSGDLLLPTQHLLDVTQVLLADGTDIGDDIEWSRSGIIRRRHGAFPDRLGGLTVTMQHGYEPAEVPDVIMLMQTIGRRARSQPGVSSQSVNGASVSYLTAGGAPLSVPLLDIEKQALDPYRLNWGLR